MPSTAHCNWIKPQGLEKTTGLDSSFQQTQWMEAMGELPIKNMTTQTNWIKMSERLPTTSDLPVIIAGARYFKILNAIIPTEYVNDDATHWKLFRDAPPTKQTRDEHDESTYVHWLQNEALLINPKAAWYAALFHERSSIRSLITEHRNSQLPAPELIRQLQERVKL